MITPISQMEPRIDIEPLIDIERTGQAVALLAGRLLENDITNRSIVVLAGDKFSGAIGLRAARYLVEEGAWIQVIFISPADRFDESLSTQFEALQALAVPIAWAEEGWELPPSDLLIDAMIGQGLQQNPQERAKELILLANSSSAPILSIDVPAGVNSEQGDLYKPHINAFATVMFGLPHFALLQPPARTHCGELYLVDIGIPAQRYLEYGIAPLPEFDSEGLFHLCK